MGLTTLHIAAQNGHLDVIEYLISHGAEVNKGDYRNDTALYIAAQNGHLDVVRCLISPGAENGHLDVVKYQISQGDEVDKGDYKDVTALHIAAKNGHLDVIDQGDEVDKGDYKDVTALHIAAKNGHLDVIEYLISQGAEVIKGHYKDVTALHIAAQNGHVDVAKYLVGEGAEVKKEITMNGHLDVVKYLISKGAEVRKGNEFGETVLHYAAQTGHLDVTKYLIIQGAEVNKGDNNGLTVLHYATQRGHLDVTKYPISRGAMEHRAYHDNRTLQKAFAKDEDLDVTKYTTLEGVEISDGAFKREISRKKSPFDIGSKLYVEDRSGKLPMYHAKDEVAKETILSRHDRGKDIGLRSFSIDTDGLDWFGTGYTSADFQIEESVNIERPKESKVSAEAVSEDFTTTQGDPNLADKREQSEQNETQAQTTESEEDHTDDEEDLINLEKYCITVRISKHEIYSAKDITVEVIEEVPLELKLKETEAIISVGLKMSPTDAIFDSPVIVTMPHCGVFTQPEHAEVFIYYRNNGRSYYLCFSYKLQVFHLFQL
nr:putative ankyrin repeat protein RF_0381 [Lytechinus pictus]